MKSPDAEFAVVIHLYYTDLWKEFLDYLKNLEGHKFDLYISITDPGFEKQIKKSRTDADVRVGPNTFSDIAPFLKLLPELMAYPFFMKIHSKKSLARWPDGRGNAIRRSAIGAICGSSGVANDCIHRMQTDQSLGMLGPNFVRGAANNKAQLGDLRARCGIRQLVRGFVAGTMFWAKSEPFRPLLPHIEYILERMPGQYLIDGSYAHACERLFGNLIMNAHLKIEVPK